MKLVAGVDIGNATTETAIARIDGKNVTFLSSGITGTTGIKGTKQNIHGVFQSLKNALDEVGFEISDLDEVRINEAAPVIGDVAMETITETIISRGCWDWCWNISAHRQIRYCQRWRRCNCGYSGRSFL